MAKRANYGFVKRQKELQKQQRKQEKAEKKRLKADSTGADEQPPAGGNDAADRSSGSDPIPDER